MRPKLHKNKNKYFLELSEIAKLYCKNLIDIKHQGNQLLWGIIQKVTGKKEASTKIVTLEQKYNLHVMDNQFGYIKVRV